MLSETKEKKQVYRYLCDKCLEEIGKSNEYTKMNQEVNTSSFVPNICTDRLGDEDPVYKDHYEVCIGSLYEKEERKEYQKIISENKIVVVFIGDCYGYKEWDFYNCLNDFAETYNSVKFLRVDISECQKLYSQENCHHLVFFYNGKRLGRTKEFNGDLVKYLVKLLLGVEQTESFKSKHHEHEVKKMKGFVNFCDICDELISEEDDVYLCLDGEFKLCQNCKNIEEGKENNPKEPLLNTIKDAHQYEEILKNEKKNCSIFR